MRSLSAMGRVAFPELPRFQVAAKQAVCYFPAMSPSTKKLLEQVESWPTEDQEELAEYAREIEARRIGVYRATPEELYAIDEAERNGVATDEEVEAAFLTFRRR
jgi:hypothetical protein